MLQSLSVTGTQEELKHASRDFEGHPFSLMLLGRYLALVHRGDVRCCGQVKLLDLEDPEGRHALEVIRSYEKWFGELTLEVAILRLLGLFDRQVSCDQLRVLLEKPTIPGLAESLVEATREESGEPSCVSETRGSSRCLP